MSEKVVLGSARYEGLVLGVTFLGFLLFLHGQGVIGLNGKGLGCPWCFCVIEEDAFASVVSFVS